MDDILINFGSELKSLGDGRFGGYLVRFTDATKKDLAGDYFTRETDFGIKSGATTPIYFNHRLPLPTRDGKEIVIKAKIGEGTLTVDEDGVLIDAIVYNREKYEKAIVEAGKQKKLGWSSGSASHLIDRDEDGHIKHWPLGLDASLTPIPCEPQNSAVPAKSYAALKFQLVDEMALVICPECSENFDKGIKHYRCDAHLPPADLPPFKGTLAEKLNKHVEDLTDDGHDREQIVGTLAAEAGMSLDAVKSVLSGEARPTDANLKAFARALRVEYDTLKAVSRRDYLQSIKGMFETALAESVPSRWELESVFNKVISKLVAAASASNLAGVTFDLNAKIDEAADEYAARLKELAKTQAAEHLESGSDEYFYLKAIITPETAPSVSEGLDLDDHSLLAVSASESLRRRFRENHEARVKSGRVLSEKNRTRLSAFRDRLRELDAECESLLADSEPKASDAEKSAARSAFLRLQWRARQSGVTQHG
jgi:hypothetical protein